MLNCNAELIIVVNTHRGIVTKKLLSKTKVMLPKIDNSISSPDSIVESALAFGGFGCRFDFDDYQGHTHCMRRL